MRIYKPQAQEGFEWIVPVKEDDFEFLATLNGTRLKSRWTPLPMELIRAKDSGEPRRRSDFPFLGTDLLVLSDRASQVVGPLVEKDAELLPVACEGRSLWLLNVCTIVDALDLDRSDVELFEPGRIMDIEKHVFCRERLQDVDVFKLENMRRGSTYLSERVVRAIEAAPLVGYGFRLVWTDEDGAEPPGPRPVG